MSGAPVLATGPVGATARRVESILRVAEAHGTGVDVSTLTDLLPADGPPSASDLTAWLEQHPSYGTVVGETAFHPSSRRIPGDLDDRRARGERYWARAIALPAGPLEQVRPLLRALAVTGSTAYGEPEAGDDLDFMAVTRRDSVWVFLTYTYLRLRLRPSTKSDPEEPGPCFNYVMDETTAEDQFAASRGLLFAREALTSRIVLGDSYYRRLVHSAGWMRAELPRLYARWETLPESPGRALGSPPWPIRWLNRALFPFVATYLQLQGLVRNDRLRSAGRADRVFRTVSRYRCLMFATERFERLRREHDFGASALGGAA